MTPPKLKKLFISYRSSDAAKVDKIARDLALLQYDDGTPRYSTWQDKHNLPPASPNWWNAIVDAIIDCDMFVMNISRGSLQSEVCRAELDYAHKRNRPIIPLILEGEFSLDPKSGKYDLPKETWALVPDWLGESQFLFYAGTEFYSRFQQAVELFERHWQRDITAPRPLNPDSKSVHGSNHALYDAACDYAERLAFADAEKHFDMLVRRNDPDYADVAAQWLELIRLYAELIDIDERRSVAFLFDKKWASYLALYPKVFLEGIFDPKGFAVRGEAPPVTPIPAAPSEVVQPKTAPAKPPPGSSSPPPGRSGEGTEVRAKPRNVELLPAPEAMLLVRRLLQGMSLEDYAIHLHQTTELLRETAVAYVDKEYAPGITALFGDLDALNDGLTDDNRHTLSRYMIEMGRTIVSLAQHKNVQSPKDEDAQRDALVSGREDPTIALDLLFVLGGYFSKGTRVNYQVEQSLSAHPLGTRSALDLVRHTTRTASLLHTLLKVFPAQGERSYSTEAIHAELESLWGEISLDRRRMTVQVLAQDFQRLSILIFYIAMHSNPRVLRDDDRTGRKLDANQRKPESTLEFYRFVSGYFRSRMS